MRTRLIAPLLLFVGASLTFSLLHSQERPGAPGSKPATPPLPTVETPSRTQAPPAPARDLSQLSELHKQHLLAAQRGADWLFRMHGLKGRFLPGYQPALRQVMQGDSYLRQAGAAAPLARAARVCGEERLAVRATQALLALLEETAPDPRDSLSRVITLPSGIVPPLAAAGALAAAIHELPAP